MVDIKLNPEEKWLETTFGTNVQKEFAKQLAKEADRKGLDKQIAAFQARWDDFRGLIKFIQGNADLWAKCQDKDNKLPGKAFDDALKGVKDAQKYAKSGDIFQAHLSLDATLEDVEKHILDKKHPFPMKGKSPLRP